MCYHGAFLMTNISPGIASKITSMGAWTSPHASTALCGVVQRSIALQACKTNDGSKVKGFKQRYQGALLLFDSPFGFSKTTQSPICRDTTSFQWLEKRNHKTRPKYPSLVPNCPALSFIMTEWEQDISRYIILDRIVYVNGASNMVLLSIFKTLSFEARCAPQNASSFNKLNRQRNYTARF